MLISNSWTNARLDNATNYGTDISTKLNALSTDVQERMKNAGLHVPASNNALSGVPFPSTDAFVSGEWNVFGESGGAPDGATKLLTLTNTAATIKNPLTVQGTLTVQDALTVQDTLTIAGLTTVQSGVAGLPIGVQGTAYLKDSTGNNCRGSNLYPLHFIVPPTFATAKITGFWVASDTLQGFSLTGWLRKRVPAWSSDGAASFTDSNIDSFTWNAATELARRKTGLSHIVNAGDLVRVGVDFNYYTQGYTLSAGLWIERLT